ncbi:DUF402 domain-containing protein [Micromonospora sp. NPDC049274]|uniref:DUF402 domain-containing protein n=1 Tax=Micromonospora sp. NPDC049274 TaxID=3154829 RepID=UPI003412DF7C
MRPPLHHLRCGEEALVRFTRGPYLGEARPTRVIAASGSTVMVWVAPETPVMRSKAHDGRSGHQIPLAERDELSFEIVPDTWRGPGIVMMLQARATSSTWWFYRGDGSFSHWYINLQTPPVWWRDGTILGADIEDHCLDVVVAPDRSWQLKDEQEFNERIGHRLYWSPDQAREIRAEADRMTQLVREGHFPFDGSWCSFRPDASWAVPQIPTGWDRPSATASDENRVRFV